MATKTQVRRAALRERLIEIGDRTIHDHGVAALRARDLAKEADCAVGAIYNVFGDLAELILAVNAMTFARLGDHVAEAIDNTAAPSAQLVAMGQAYHSYARVDYNRWRALFDYERPEDEAAPDWYLERMATLFGIIAKPLAALNPDLSQTDLQLLTRALFSSIHGIVSLSLARASAGVPPEQIDRMIALVLQKTSAERTS